MNWKDGLTAAVAVGLGYWGLTKVVKGPIYHAEYIMVKCDSCGKEKKKEETDYQLSRVSAFPSKRPAKGFRYCSPCDEHICDSCRTDGHKHFDRTGCESHDMISGRLARKWKKEIAERKAKKKAESFSAPYPRKTGDYYNRCNDCDGDILEDQYQRETTYTRHYCVDSDRGKSTCGMDEEWEDTEESYAESYSADECNACGTMMAISPCCETSYCPAQDFDCDCEKHYDPTRTYPETDPDTGERYGNWEWSDDFWYQPKNAKSFAAYDGDIFTDPDYYTLYYGAKDTDGKIHLSDYADKYRMMFGRYTQDTQIFPQETMCGIKDSKKLTHFGGKTRWNPKRAVKALKKESNVCTKCLSHAEKQLWKWDAESFSAEGKGYVCRRNKKHYKRTKIHPDWGELGYPNAVCWNCMEEECVKGVSRYDDPKEWSEKEKQPIKRWIGEAESFSAEDGWEVLTCPSCIAPLGASSYNTHENTNIHCMKCMEQFDELKSIPLYHKGKKMRAESFSADSKCDHSNLIGDVSEVLSWAEYRCLDCGATQYHEFPEMNYENVEALELIDTDHKIRSDFYARLERDYPLPEDWEAESHAYSYAYNEGHSDSRKTGEYRPSLSTPKQEAAFKRILKQKAEEDEEFPHTKQFLCGLEGHKWKMKPLKKTCKKCGLVIKNRLRGHR